MLNNLTQTNKMLFIIFIFIFMTLSGCFSNAKKELVIIVDKSTGEKNINHFSNNSQVKKAIMEKKINNKIIRNTKKKPVKNTKIRKKNVLIPVAAKIIKPFSKNHLGLSFATKSGQKVRAINNGTVVYSGNQLKSHGKMIIIRHPLGFYSTYAKNQSLNVQSGEKVKKGQIIATTGNVNFYFEMKKFETPINPTKYLK